MKVILKREAWAKSHRPVGTLFRNDRAPVVGGGDLGVMIVEGRPSRLAEVKAEIAKAETQTRMRFDENKGKEVPHPSPQKSETGAIERIELYGPSDKRSFSVEEGVAWLSNPMTDSGYEVELFNISPPRSEWDRLDAAHRRLVETFVNGFHALEYSMSVERLPVGGARRRQRPGRHEQAIVPAPPAQRRPQRPMGRHRAGELADRI